MGSDKTMNFRSAKIVCTLGPASDSAEMIERLMRAGMDVARLNFSHGTHEEHARTIKRLREASARLSKPIGILADLQGPKIRTGALVEGKRVQLRAGQSFTISTRDFPGTSAGVSTTYKRLPRDVSRGDRILLGDGLIELRVLSTTSNSVVCKVVNGGELGEHKGINLPGVKLRIPAMTPRDRVDLAFALRHGANFVAVSFVRRAEDVLLAKAAIKRARKNVPVIAKLEKPEAIENLDAILRVSDGVMVARGDLGVELPFEEVPAVQKRLIREANRCGKPVITATQMLESMVHHPRPTRAEASDVANAILDGTDAVMLSAETAMGEYPFEAVRAMDRIIREMERQGPAVGVGARDERRLGPGETVSVEDAIAIGTSAVARMLRTPLIVTLTSGGFTSRKVAALRTPVPILAVTTQATTYRQLALVWGVTPVVVDRVPGYDAMLAVVRDLILKRGYARAGDRIVMTAGLPWEVSGTTNLLKVEVV